MDVVERLIAQAVRTPDATAVAQRDRNLSYAAFAARAEAFAARFAATPRPRVLIALEKGVDAYAAMFGTLMAGGVYAPVNVGSPRARLAHIRNLFAPDLIVAAGPLADQLCDGGPIVDPSDVPIATVAAARAPSPDDLAYVIFTSGSTGAPKGVAVSRGALAHYVDWLGPALGIGPGDRLSQHPNIGFDLSVLDIFGALCFGAALHPFVETSARLLPARKVRDEGITIWNSVPSVAAAMETAGELDATHLRSVRLFTFCGEVLHRHQVAKLLAARPDAIVLNTYGPTEATVAMTCRRFIAETFGTISDASAPLGEPIGAMRLDLVGGADADEGEIVISGPQLAVGYWRDPALTAEKFRDHMTPAGTVRAFYTGDHARRVGGDLYFLGRSDDMVKLAGHRVHLGEVRHALERLGWTRVAVFEAEGALHAVVERMSGVVFDETSIRAALADRLDGYFVPRTIRCVDRFPLTANDKLDVAALKTIAPPGVYHL